jgi:ABC-type antimicrobial peptide transport system permease subunit
MKEKFAKILGQQKWVYSILGLLVLLYATCTIIGYRVLDVWSTDGVERDRSGVYRGLNHK